MKSRIKTSALVFHASALLIASFAQASADGAKDATLTPAPAAEVPRLQFYGWIEGGATGNTGSPNDGQNFGRLFDDRSNQALLNQVSATAERALDPKATGFDWGFKTQIMYGSDARFTHSVGLLDQTGSERCQPDLVEAYLNLHFPVLTEGGVDLKVGKAVTLEGAETIDPRTNFFYSHTYIFNFGIPMTYTGATATVHVTKELDLIGGVTRGVNTSTQDNNGSAAFQGGFGLNLQDGKLVILAITHLGPETPDNNHDYRYLNDITATWKITDKLTSITDVNYTYDQFAKAPCYGAAESLTYQLNDWLGLGARGEIWADPKGSYAVQYGNNTDPMSLLRDGAVYDPRTALGGDTTYGALTLGVNIKAPVSGPIIKGLMIRPEVRLDTALNSGKRPFNDSKDRSMVTFGLDAIMTF